MTGMKIPAALKSRWVLIALGLILVGCLALWMLGCGHLFRPPMPPTDPGFRSPPGTDPIIIALNLVAWGGILLAVASLVLSAWLPIPKTTAGMLLLCAIGAWALKILLVKLWWLVLLVAAGLLVGFIWHFMGGTALHMEGRRGWLVWMIERWTKQDMNKDGTIGEPPTPKP